MEGNYRLKMYLPNEIFFSYPLGFDKLKEVSVLDDEFRIETRVKIEGKLTFTGRDYTILKELDDSERMCDYVNVDVEQKIGDIWYFRRAAMIKMKDAVLNSDKCTCVVSLLTNDTYALYEMHKKDDLDFFDSGATRQRIYSMWKDNNWIGIGTPNVDEWGNEGHFNGVLVYDIMRWIIQSMYGAINVRSDFFQWDGDTSYSLAYSRNLTRLTLSNKSDNIRWGYVGYTPASKMLSTPEELMTTLCVCFNLKYKITAQEFRIEHYSWWDEPIVLDFTSGSMVKYLDGKGEWSYSDKVRKIERFSSPDAALLKELKDATTSNFVNAGHYEDFIGRDIIYDNACVNDQSGDDAVKQYSVPYYLALSMIQDIYYNPNEDLDGICLGVGFEFQPLGGPPTNYTLAGILSSPPGQVQWGNELSWAQLHDAFHRDGRMFLRGNMNDVDTTFNSSLPFKLQKNIKIPLCGVDLLPLSGKVKTPYGTGFINSISWDYRTKNATLEIAYQKGYTGMSEPVLLPEGFATSMNTVFNSVTSLTVNDTGVVSVYAETKATAAGGSVTILSTGHFQYTPPLNYVGLDSFTYYGIDVNGNTSFMRVDAGVRPTTLYVRSEIRPGRNAPNVGVAHYQNYAAFYADAACTDRVDVTGMIIFLNVTGYSVGTYGPMKGVEYLIEVAPTGSGFTFSNIGPSAQYTVIGQTVFGW